MAALSSFEGSTNPSENGVFFLLTDHLGSTTATIDANGQVVGQMRYKPWGQTRYNSGSTPTDYQYTGQKNTDLGIYFYNARWFDPQLGRFLSADTLIPQPGNPLDWDRYSYSRNNPINYNDPNGHCPLLVTALIGAGIAAAVDYSFQVIDNVQTGQSFGEAILNVDGAEIVGAAVAGGIAGATLGLGMAALAFAGGAAATSSMIAVPVAALAGGVGNALGGQVGALAEAATRQIENTKFDNNMFYTDAFDAGFLNSEEALWDVGAGAILGAAGQAFSNVTAPSSSRYQFYNQYKDLEGDMIRVPRNNLARLPWESEKPLFRGGVAGFMRKTSNVIQEVISQRVDRE